MNYTQEQTEELARAFSRSLLREINWENLYTVIHRNKTEDYQHGCCATHDFCDPNILMLEAFEKLHNIDFDVQDSTHSDCFNAAWVLARANDFYIVDMSNGQELKND
jgi:hypothetical protein